MADLKTNYKDDVLDTSKNEKRKFRMIQNDDGTVSFDDATEYTQQGDAFGAADINATNAKINEQTQSLTKIHEGKEPAKKVYGSWNSERSNEVTIDTSGFRNGVYIIFNTYTDVKPLVEFIVKTNGKIATTNISMDSSINGDKITYACGSFWCMFFAKMIEPLG